MVPLFDGRDVEDTGSIRVNEAYATRFEYSKSREDPHRLIEKNPALAAKLEAQAASGRGGAAVSEEEEDTSSDEDEEPAEQMNGEFLEALLKIRNRDATIYQPDAVLFPDEDIQNGSAEPSKVKKHKPVYLRQVIAEQALAEAGKCEVEVVEEPATYLEEQDELKQDFLRAAEDENREVEEGSFGGVMQARRHAGGAPTAVDEKLLEEVFGKAGNNDGDSFLKDYIARQAWDEDAEENHVPLHQKVAEQLAEDEEDLQRADTFEASYNFRFQEDDSAQIVTYPREVEGLVRKADDRRKLARKRKAERKEAAVAERAAEVRRLKNIKRGEVDARLAEIQRISGHQSNAALSKLVEGDFDPEAYDAAMAAAFDADYYQGEDEGDVMAEDLARELAEIDGYGEEIDAVSLDREGASSAAASGDDGAAKGTAGAEHARQLHEQKAGAQQLMDEYFKLDYESTAGGLPCRFRYKEVPAASYGLDVLDILGIDNKDLNQVVSMKKLAPYREDAGLARPNYAKVRELKNKLHEEQAAARKLKAGGKRKHGSDTTQSVPATEGGNAALPAIVKPVKKQRSAGLVPAVKKAEATPLPQPPAQPDAKSTAAAAARSERNQIWQREKRLETFAPLSLRRPDKELSLGAEKRLKNKIAEVEKASKVAGATNDVLLTKAQKKNFKRGIKRRAEAEKGF